jgi:hypothetical protein
MNRMNDDFTGAFPSAKKIAEDTGYSVDVVYDATAELIVSGLFARERGEGLRGAYVYRIAKLELLAIAIEEFTAAEKAKRDLRLAARGRPHPHVAGSQGSPTASPTSGSQPHVPQADSLTEGEPLSAQGSAREAHQPAGSHNHGMNGSEAVLVKRLAKLMGEYGDEAVARSTINRDLARAMKNPLLKGSPVGRLAIAIEDMEAKKLRGQSIGGEPTRRLYAFMTQVDPADADRSAKALHKERAKQEWEFDPNKTAQENADAYAASDPKRARNFEIDPDARQRMINLFVSKGARHD